MQGELFKSKAKQLESVKTELKSELIPFNNYCESAGRGLSTTGVTITADQIRDAMCSQGIEQNK